MGPFSMGGMGRSGWVVRPHSRLYSIRLGIEIENVHLFISPENLGEKRKHGEGLIEEGPEEERWRKRQRWRKGVRSGEEMEKREKLRGERCKRGEDTRLRKR